MKFLPFLLALFVVSCSPSQFTLYKPVESEPAWRVTVEKTGLFNNFTCSINDTLVMEESFKLFKHDFEKDGVYRGKKIKMSGYESQVFANDGGGKQTVNNHYQIRVFIDEHEAGKFDF